MRPCLKKKWKERKGMRRRKRRRKEEEWKEEKKTVTHNFCPLSRLAEAMRI